MTSTYTQNKYLEEPANGDYNASWNVPVNNDWSLIDTCFGGHVSINAVGASGITVLTLAQYQPPNIIITGTLTANVNYQLPAGVGGVWTIYNGTSGSYTVTFSSASGGASITLPQGWRTQAVCDGSNVSFASTASAAYGTSLLALLGATSGYVGLASPATGAVTFTLPGTDGTNGQVLATNGSAVLSWINNGSGGGGVTSWSGGSTGLTPSGAGTGIVTMAGTLNVANGGTGATTGAAALAGLAGGATAGYYLRGNGSGIVLATIQAADVPTLNQNTSGNAATATYATSAGSATTATSATNATYATQWTTGRNIILSGDVSGTTNISGVANATMTTTVTSATTSTAGKVALATSTDVNTGTDNTKATTAAAINGSSGHAKAWVKFTGSTTNGAQTILKAFNVSAVTRTSGGHYTVTMSNLSDANFAWSGSAKPSSGNDIITVSESLGTTPTSTTLYISVASGTTAEDPTTCSVIFFD